ncbi:GNAT family N-acetyltransferase [uncultured Acetobacteroides sp.]|uniref:GNAT family N-acetyltransferase n=1 Tax=uncultured Acetobacteroides sp. TaxID=1760811 RepID=UPI0029F4ACEB|nr:GNAT family N-acetyltransferase [uncultured Acetobacteroides sp.]
MVVIETKRLFIKHISTSDICQLHRIYNKTKNMQFISTGRSEWTINELNDKYAATNINYELGFGIFAIEIKETSEVIGEAGIFNSFNNLSKLELGYIIDSKHWQKGYGKETCLGLIDYAFTVLNVETLIARMYSKNINSIILSEKCGMVKIETGLTDNGQEYLTYEIKRGMKAQQTV